MSQTSYQQDPNPAVEGMLADISLDREIRTAIPSEVIEFGRFVTVDSADDEGVPSVSLPNAAADITGLGVSLGFALNDITLEETTVGWAINSAMRVLRSGWLWVLPEEAVTYGDAVFVRHTAGGGGSDLGRTRTDADTASAAQLAGAYFRSTTSTAALALVEFRP